MDRCRDRDYRFAGRWPLLFRSHDPSTDRPGYPLASSPATAGLFYGVESNQIHLENLREGRVIRPGCCCQTCLALLVLVVLVFVCGIAMGVRAISGLDIHLPQLPTFTFNSPFQITVMPDGLQNQPNSKGMSICGSSPKARLVPGRSGQVAKAGNDANVYLRQNPSTNAPIVFKMPRGYVFDVLEGPVCVDNYLWWHLATPDGCGWAAEGRPGQYFLEPGY